jgi:VanZ family protein
MAVIAWFSTATWSAENTGGILVTIARTFLPGLSPRDLVALHYFARKLAHLTVYGILAALWWRALVRERRATPSAAVWIALAVSLVWASLDEIHQVFAPSRTGSVVDVAIDGTGAALALALIRHGAGAALGLGGVLLWTAALGGVAVLVVDHLAGVSSGLLWVTTPAAGALLGLLRLWRTRTE